MNATSLRWHLPSFTEWQCAGGAMTERERLGLPDRFVETDLQREIASALPCLRALPAGRQFPLAARRWREAG